MLRKIEDYESASEWESMKKELDAVIWNLKMAQENLGNAQTELRVRELEVQVDDVVRKKDIKTAKALIGMVQKLHQRLCYFQNLVNFVNNRDVLFDSYRWTNKGKARKVIDRALEAINKGNITVEQLDAFTDTIWSMQIHEPITHSSDSTSSNNAGTTLDKTVNEDKRKRLLT